MNSKGTKFADAIETEVAQWPGVTVAFVEGGPHPKARFTFDGAGLSRPFSGTASNPMAIKQMLGDMRRVMKQLGATRTKPESSDEDEEVVKRFAPPNPGREMRPDPVASQPVKQRDPKEPLTGLFVSPAASLLDDFEQPARRQAMAEVEPEPPAALATEIADGIYFGMEADAYHAIRRLSASAVQKLAVSAGTFWESSWFNPRPKAPTDDDTAARRVGRAYHMARLEPDIFAQRYIRELGKDDLPRDGAVYTGTDIERELQELGQPMTKKGEKVLDKAMRLSDAGYSGTIWPLEYDLWDRRRRSMIPPPEPLSAKLWDEIATDMERLHINPDIAKHLIGGEPEVSVFWTDARGLTWKCRFDYLMPAEWSDFKTFANPRRKHLFDAIRDAFQWDRHYIQAAIYRDGSEMIRAGALDVMGEASDGQKALVAAIACHPEPLDCWYIFQEKGGIPNILARQVIFETVPPEVSHQHAGASAEGIARVEAARRGPTKLYRKGLFEIERACRTFVAYQEIYPEGEAWLPVNASGAFEDADFNRFWLEEDM